MVDRAGNCVIVCMARVAPEKRYILNRLPYILIQDNYYRK